MNVLFILSDQHNAANTGCYGHPLAVTPNLDRLARQGARFDHAYSSCPICVPARAAMFTGRHVFENGCWDNTAAWDGRLRGWSHHLTENGVELVTVGKLDFNRGHLSPSCAPISPPCWGIIKAKWRCGMR